MEKKEVECPKCGAGKRQQKKGYTSAGSQRMYCSNCGCKYTPKPKSRAYSEDVRKQALRLLALGNTGRGIGKVLNMNRSNAYRWAREEAKKTKECVDKPANKS